MDPTRIPSHLLDGLNMDNDDYQILSPQLEVEVGQEQDSQGLPGHFASTPGSTTSRPITRKTKSLVWDCFDPEEVTGSDGRVVSMACCKFTKNLLTGSKKGT